MRIECDNATIAETGRKGYYTCYGTGEHCFPGGCFFSSDVTPTEPPCEQTVQHEEGKTFRDFLGKYAEARKHREQVTLQAREARLAACGACVYFNNLYCLKAQKNGCDRKQRLAVMILKPDRHCPQGAW